MVVRRVIGLLGLGALLLLPGLKSEAETKQSLPPSAQQMTASPPIHVRPSYFLANPLGYTPNQIRHAYGFDQSASTGYGQTIAIVDAYGSPTIQNDLNAFCARFGLRTQYIQIAYPTGRPATVDQGWALETALDVEWAHAMAPGAGILLVVARSNSFADLLPAVDYAASHARQVSMSWGAPEFAGETAYDYHFNRPGVTFTASSGDNGAGVEWPAASPYVTSVGGTTLKLDSTGAISQEVAWSGSGGGVSLYEPNLYQSVWGSSARSVPDVSFDADPNTGMAVYDGTSYFGLTGWIEVGGTSAGAPQWAALIALANAGHTPAYRPTNGLLYALNSPSNFLDITAGSNGFPAGLGYDPVTGLGSPIAGTLIPQFAVAANLH
jgi:subtilase family serine protease